MEYSHESHFQPQLLFVGGGMRFLASTHVADPTDPLKDVRLNASVNKRLWCACKKWLITLVGMSKDLLRTLDDNKRENQKCISVHFISDASFCDAGFANRSKIDWKSCLTNVPPGQVPEVQQGHLGRMRPPYRSCAGRCQERGQVLLSPTGV
ncbi:hypothetical protein BC830DRAFT_369185 [Chytriomyces sp. MP71]|nr:hypothetical protein BC830DRAFT_369185 [Chytriomyces sp. MP71]